MKPLEIARRRLRNSRLTGTGFTTPEEAVGWHLAMQAQDYGPAKWSVGQRSKGLTDPDLDEALAAGSIVRTHVLRPTWHFVARDDIRWLLALSGPRVQQGSAGRRRQLDLDGRTLARCEKVIASALEGGNRLTRNEIAAVLDGASIDRSGQRMPYILMHCELEALIGSGGLAGKQQTYALLDERVPKARRFDREKSMVDLVRRYLTSHGPATVKDMSWWSGLTMTDLRKALDLLGPSEVLHETVDGLELWSVASDEAAPPPVRGAHLLQTYDELVVGFTESRFYGDPGAEQARAAWGDRTYPSGGFLLNGRIGGHWRRTLERDAVAVEVHLYGELKRGDTNAIEKAAADLGRFHGLPVELEVRSASSRGRR
jgi:winged helix DNA-binding protein